MSTIKILTPSPLLTINYLQSVGKDLQGNFFFLSSCVTIKNQNFCGSIASKGKVIKNFTTFISKMCSRAAI